MVSANQRAFVRTSALWAVYENFTATYLVAFALLLGASNIMVGVFGAIPFIAVLLSELIGAKLTEYWARVPIIVVTYAIDKTMWVLIALLPWFTLTNPLVVLVILYFINQFFITLREPSVVSLTADIVEERKRGAYFGRVNRATGAAALVATITAGWFITRMGDTSQLGYSLLFGAGALFGYAAMWSFSTMTEPRRVGNSHYTVKDVLRFDGSFRHFCFRASFFWFAAKLASPFVSAYILRDLGLSVVLFGLAIALQQLTMIVFYRPWGKFSDRYGDRALALIGLVGTSIVMFLWFNIRPDTLWLIIPTQILSGLVWAATETALYNLVLDMTDRRHRPLQVAQYSIFNALAQAIGPIAGGILADSAGLWMISGVPLVFLASSILRFAASLLFIGMHEPRIKRQYSMRAILYGITRHRIAGVHFHPSQK